MFVLPLDGDRKPRPVAVTSSLEGYATFSPDGRWIAYCAGDPGDGDYVYLDPYPPTGSRTRLSTTMGSSPQWSATGREVFYSTPTGDIMRVDVVASGSSIRAGVPRLLVKAPALFSHGGFVLDRSSLRVLTPADNPTSSNDSMNVLLNWPAALAAR